MNHPPMNRRHIIAMLIAIIPALCFSQIEKNDSASIGINAADSIRAAAIAKPDSISDAMTVPEYRWAYYSAIDVPFPYRSVHPLDLHIPDLHFTPGQARLLHWSGGEIIASGGTTPLPGMMLIDNGAAGIYQSAGNFAFYAGGIANRYGYFRGAHTQYGLNGSISYQFSPRLSATVFGDYYFGRAPLMANGMPMPPSMIGYYGRSKYGGYVDFRISERWGVEAGAQTVQQVGTNRYQAEPILTPYYKISKKVAIGLPVGQILYHILKK